MTAPATSASTHPRPPRRRLWIALATLLLLVPLAAGAVVAYAAKWEPAQAWNADGQQVLGAPAPQSAGSAASDPALVDARRAAGLAQTQAGFLETGTDKLTDGTGQLRGGAGELADGVDDLVAGAQELVNGMTQLQAGTGELGAGATELADGVGTAVDQVVGLGAVQGQILTALDSTLDSLQDVDTPQAREISRQLEQLRTQVATFRIDNSLTDQLTKLKDGSRELANQLDVPGYAYHDGIFQATEGAKRLNSALGELNGRVDEALAGVDELDDGAQQLQTMAEENKANLDKVQRSLPATAAMPGGATSGAAGAGGTGQGADADAAGAGGTGQAAGGTGAEDPGAEGSGARPLLSPVVAVLIAALILLGGFALGAVWASSHARVFRLRTGHLVAVLVGGTVLLTALGVGLFAILASSVGPVNLAWAGLVSAVAVVASAASARAIWGAFGAGFGSVVLGVFGLAQALLVGWLWKSAAAADVSAVWLAVANLSPLNWTTLGLTVAGNSGTWSLLYTAAGVLVATAAVGGVLIAWQARVAAGDAHRR